MLRSLQILGLDIGTTAVKAARVRRRGDRWVVTGLARAAIDRANQPAASAVTMRAAAVSRCLQGLDQRAAEVACSLSGPEVAVRTFDLPALAEPQLASAVTLEAAQTCPFDLGEGTVAYQTLRGPRARPRRRRPRDPAARAIGIFAATKNEAIRNLQAVCTEAHAHCVIVDVDGLALLNCLDACRLRRPGETVMVLNLGGTYANLAVIAEDGLPFVLDIACAGAGNEPDPAGAWPEACAALADRVLEAVRYHGARQSGLGVDRILLCGGQTQAEPVVAALTRLLPGKVEIWNPLTVLSWTPRVQASGLVEQGPAFAVALGLAMRPVRDVHN